ncbi:MAG: hypothetical protein JNM93_00080 [Bacteriovoracaceae bacterium]|nr:hypothetical protein [Bacteriovoracaceae bacterium]
MKKLILVFSMLCSMSVMAQTFSFGDGPADMVMTGTTPKYYVCTSMTTTSGCNEVATRPMDPTCQFIYPQAAHGEQEFSQYFFCPATSSANPKCKYGFEVACGDGRYQWAMNPWYRTQVSQFPGNMWGQPPMMYPWMMNGNYGYNPYMNNNYRQPSPMPFGGTGSTTTTGGTTTGGPAFSFGT